MIHRALLAEEDRRRAARENFHMTSVAVTQHASYEPALLHSPEDHEDGKIYCAGQRCWLSRMDKSISTHNSVLHCTLTACVGMASQLLRCQTAWNILLSTTVCVHGAQRPLCRSLFCAVLLTNVVTIFRCVLMIIIGFLRRRIWYRFDPIMVWIFLCSRH